MWNNQGHSFANQFERQFKDGRWRGVFSLNSPTPRTISDGETCVCHGTLTGNTLREHFNTEVEITRKFIEDKFGKVKVLNVGTKFTDGTTAQVVFMIKFWDNEDVCRLDIMTKEQRDLCANHSREIRWEIQKLVLSKTEKGREQLEKRAKLDGIKI